MTLNLTFVDAPEAVAEHTPVDRLTEDYLLRQVAHRFDVNGYDIVRHDSVSHVSVCMLVMQNGFTIIGHSAPASIANFDAEIGRNLAYKHAFGQIWPLEGYRLRTRLKLLMP